MALESSLMVDCKGLMIVCMNMGLGPQASAKLMTICSPHFITTDWLTIYTYVYIHPPAWFYTDAE